MSKGANFEGKPFNIEKLICNINKTIEQIILLNFKWIKE